VIERLGFREVDAVRKYIGTPRPTRSTSGVWGARPTDAGAIVEGDARAFGARRDA
jgi:hypothetical protein